MPRSRKVGLRHAVKAAVSIVPWLVSMYLFYWLDASGTWTAETPHRGKLSVALLAAGMGLSFLLYSYLNSRQPK